MDLQTRVWRKEIDLHRAHTACKLAKMTLAEYERIRAQYLALRYEYLGLPQPR